MHRMWQEGEEKIKAPVEDQPDSMEPLPLPNHLGEDDLNQECKEEELLTSLTSEECCFGNRLCLYRGFWFPSETFDEFLSCRKTFRARNSDVILVTIPKSGTTWLKAILFSLSNRSDSGKPNPLLTNNPHELVPFLDLNLALNNQNPDLSSLGSPMILATHIPYPLLPESIKDSKCKVVYMSRNVKDNFTSLWHFASKFRTKERGGIVLEELLDQFCRGLIPYGPCWDHALGYWKASLEMPEKVLFLKYEDMKERPVEIVKRMAEFIGCPFEGGEDEDEAAKEILRMCSLETLSNLEVNKTGTLQYGLENKLFFRRGEVGDWMNLLSSEMADKLDRITEEKLKGSGLKL